MQTFYFFRQSTRKRCLWIYTICSLILPLGIQAGPLEDALDGNAGTFVTPDGSNAAWGVTGAVVHSGAVNAGQTSRISVTVDGPGTMGFFWRINSGIFGNPANGISAGSSIDSDLIVPIENTFIPESIRVNNGSQKVSWTYQQNQNPTGGFEERAGLDAVFYIPHRKRTASDAASDKFFGSASALAGNLALIGAEKGDGAVAGSGAAYLFDMTDPLNPVEKSKLQASDGASDDLFGNSVAICGDLALVGARADDTLVDKSGSAYLFDISDPENPVEVAKLLASDAVTNDFFGTSLALQGNLALVGMDGLTQSRHAVYLFDISDPTNPEEVSRITASDSSAQFGQSIAVDGDLAVGGDIFADGNTGAAFLFDISNPAAPFETARITASDRVDDDFFGDSVDIQGTQVLVGASKAITVGNGAAYLFDVTDPGNPVETAKIEDSDGESQDRFGSSVALSGDFALIASDGDDATAGLHPNSGSAHLYDLSNPATPTERAEITVHDLGGDDKFGRSVAIAGNRLISTTESKNTNTGAAYFPSLPWVADLTEIFPSEHSLSAAGGTYPVRINAIGPWTATNDSTFTTTDSLSGTGNGSIRVTVPENLSLRNRTAKVMLNGVEHTLVQRGNTDGSAGVPRINAPRKVKFRSRTAKVKGTISGGFAGALITAKANGGAKAKVRGRKSFRIKVKKIKRRVTRLKLSTTNAKGRSDRHTVKIIRR